MNRLHYEEELKAAIAAARDAAIVIDDHAGQIQSGIVRAKGVNDLVTEVDLEAQRIIKGRLSAAFPSYKILAEEDVADDAPTAAVDGMRWIIDPIDGTTNFMHGVPPYAVSIALHSDGDAVVGVVLDVARDELFTAVKGEGTFADGRRVEVSQSVELSESLMTTGFPYRRFKDVDAYLEVLRSVILSARGVRRPGSASVDLAYVAAGRFDGFYESGLAPWDVAAGCLLVTEAGGTVSAFDGESDPVFDRQIVATNGSIHTELLAHLAPLKNVRS